MSSWGEADTRASLARTAEAYEGPLYPEGMVELRVFHASGYNSIDVAGDRAFDLAQEARFEFAKVRRLILIDWGCIDDEGRVVFMWHWERPEVG